MTRKLVSVKVIDSVRPIENADKIEVATVGGWNVVVGKDSFHAGDKVAFFEIDTVLPMGRPEYQEFMKRGVKKVKNPKTGERVLGHVLKTVRLRGVFSQGLIMSLSELGLNANDVHVGDELTDIVHVFKFEPDTSDSNNILGVFDIRFAPKSDAERVQNLKDHWDEIVNMRWVPTVKVDGQSRTFVNDGGNIRLFSRNNEIQAEGDEMDIAQRLGILDVLRDNEGMAVQAEFLGERIQKNRLKINGRTLKVFAVFMDGVKLPREKWDERLLPSAVPVLGAEWEPQGTLESMIDKVSTIRGNITKNVADEGVVFHLAEGQEAPSWIDRNGNFKIVSNKYLLKNED